MKCKYCGHELEKTDTVCPKCKAAVKSVEPEKAQKKTKEE